MQKEKLNSQERILIIIKILAQNHYAGLRVKDLAKILKTTESNICRDVAILEHVEFIEKNEGGKIRLSVDFGAISHAIAKSYKTARLKLTEDEAKYISNFV